MNKLRGKIKHASRQSNLIKFFQANRAWFARELAEAGVPNWDLIAKMLCDEGVLDARGNPPNKDAVRMAWARVARTPVKQPQAMPEPLSPPAATHAPISSAPDYLAIAQSIKEKRRLK